MDVGLPRRDHDLPDPIRNPYAIWVRDALEVAYDQVRRHSGQAVLRQKRLYDRRTVRRLFAVGDWTLRYYPPAKKFLPSCISRGMGCGCSIAPGFADSTDSLSGSQKDSAPEGLGVLDLCAPPGFVTYPSGLGLVSCVALRGVQPPPRDWLPGGISLMIGSQIPPSLLRDPC